MTSESKPNSLNSLGEFPDAVPISTAPSGRRIGTIGIEWWLVGLCIAFALGLAAWQFFRQGTSIVVRFRDGYGIQAENRLMHRGIEIGIVDSVESTSDLNYVDVKILVAPAAGSIMREGSRFWIERPKLSLTGVRGLDTIVSGRYVAVEPGPSDGKICRSFQGLDEPLVGRSPSNSLEIILEAPELRGLQIDAPVIYRGLTVGRVSGIGLSADSRWIQVRAMIEPDYRNLVRRNSRFWNHTGLRIDVGLSGVEIDAESLAGIAVGGIEFATPDDPADVVHSGQRFELLGRSEAEWKSWKPRLVHGNRELESFGETPAQERLNVAWKEEVILGFKRSVSKRGWLLSLDDGTVIGPSDLFNLPTSALPDSVTWELAGSQWKPSQWSSVTEDPPPQAIARGRLTGYQSKFSMWPVSRIGEWSADKSKSNTTNHRDGGIFPFWIVGDVPNRWIPIEAHQIDTSNGPPWRLETGLGVQEEQHGSAVVDGSTGKLVGLVLVDEKQAVIHPVQMR
jgi:hypothetical protein